LLQALSRCKDQFREEERQALVNKYVPVALNSLYTMLSNKQELTEANKGELQE